MDEDNPVQLSFEALESWSYPRIRQYQYSFITDKQIKNELKSKSIDHFQLADSWHKLTDNSSTLSDNPIHLKIIAKMVIIFSKGKVVPAVNILAEDDISSGYCVIDGHHRLRTMQYLGWRKFEAVLNGRPEAIDELIGK